jgi:hypothetical protein
LGNGCHCMRRSSLGGGYFAAGAVCQIHGRGDEWRAGQEADLDADPLKRSA